MPQLTTKTTIISLLVFASSFILSSIAYYLPLWCSDIIGDGYAMGTDPAPVVIGQSCSSWKLGDAFTEHAILSALLALVLAGIVFYAMQIFSWRSVHRFQHVGMTILYLILVVLLFIASSYVVAQFNGGSIEVDSTTGKIGAFLSILFSQLIAYLLLQNLHTLLRRKS